MNPVDKIPLPSPSPKSHALLGATTAIAMLLADQMLFPKAIGYLLVVALLTLIGLIAGPRLPLFLRAFSTTIIFISAIPRASSVAPWNPISPRTSSK